MTLHMWLCFGEVIGSIVGLVGLVAFLFWLGESDSRLGRWANIVFWSVVVGLLLSFLTALFCGGPQ